MPRTPFRDNLTQAYRFAIGSGSGLLLWDLWHLVGSTRHQGIGFAQVSVALASIATCLSAGILLGMLIAPIYAFCLENKRFFSLLANLWSVAKEKLKQRPIYGATTDNTIRNIATTHAALFAAPIALAVFALISFILFLRVFNHVQIATNAAAASVLIAIVSMSFALFAFFSARGATVAVFTKIARYKRLGWYVERPWISAAAIVVSALLVLYLLLMLLHTRLSALDYTRPKAVLLALCIGIVFAAGGKVISVSAKVCTIITISTIIAAFGLWYVVLFGISYTSVARSMLMKSTTWTAMFNRVVIAKLDRDKDSYSSFFGDNDCQPNNFAINPGAVDIPDNGVDEDCSGSDAKTSANLWKQRWDYPLADDFIPQPDIILITVDAFNPDHLSINGYHRKTSPQLDAFANNSVRFTNAYAVGPNTRLSLPPLLTSMYNIQIKRQRDGRRSLPIASEALTIAEILSEAGYRTVFIPPITLFSTWKGLDQGFEIVDDSVAKMALDVSSEKLTQAAIEQIKKAKQPPRPTKPLFLWLHYFDPHTPYLQPENTPVFGKREVDVYDAEVFYTDKFIGQLLQQMDQYIPENKRVVIITADHSESFDELHPTFHHSSDLHSSVLRVPLLIQAPHTTPRIETGQVSLLDIAPTIVNLTQNQRKFHFEGTSLVPALMGHSIDPDRVTFHDFFLPERMDKTTDPLRAIAVRTTHANYIYDRDNNIRMLFDFNADPVELRNLIELRTPLADQMHDWMQMWMNRMKHSNRVIYRFGHERTKSKMR